MANYNLKTETTTHIAGMQVVSPEVAGGGVMIPKILI